MMFNWQAALGRGDASLAEVGEDAAGSVRAYEPFKWKQNGLRRSFINYRVAEVQSLGRVALEAGNTAQVVFSNYRELVTPRAAREWLGITPQVVVEAKSAREAQK